MTGINGETTIARVETTNVDWQAAIQTTIVDSQTTKALCQTTKSLQKSKPKCFYLLKPERITAATLIDMYKFHSAFKRPK
ncbi:hypothetical protein JSQ81_15370 [Sporosarcina sp. Marseille-Q4063]|uniref:hypothetical protein n=1 Tax=Sporosarcina sp. Marseille-Q4063 TaxID=2810514 RepID=UPI001BB07A45|nr:hypothetical protein [Sporosarcina sp. Marseille-Q4063]QUW21178.1 hypothetical protein JSQ81_15370 [Sporosarcina sp. Marseille-Q4063]